MQVKAMEKKKKEMEKEGDRSERRNTETNAEMHR